MASSPSKLPPHLRALLASTDRGLLRLSTILSTPSGIDNTLATLSYTLAFAHSRLTHRLSNQLARLADEIITNASKALLPGETLIAAIPPPPPMSRLALLVSSTKAAADTISDFRIFVRLWGLLGIYQWARATYIDPPTDRVVKTITWAQVAVNTLYQFLENGAYLASKGVLNGKNWTGDEGARRQAKWWAWSSRFWAAHVGLEFMRLGWELKVQREQQAQDGLAAAGDEKEAKILKQARIQQRREWWNDVIANAAYAPMTLHWSVEEGLLAGTWVSMLGMIAGAVRLKERWIRSADAI